MGITNMFFIRVLPGRMDLKVYFPINLHEAVIGIKQCPSDVSRSFLADDVASVATVVLRKAGFFVFYVLEPISIQNLKLLSTLEVLR